METRRCPSCAREISSPVCPHCGFPAQNYNDLHHLPIGTLLRGRYQVGRVLGQGGFGITYLGWDTLMETVVAIKEFYPSSTVNRNSSFSTQVQCNTSQMTPQYQASLERFLREAKALVKFRDIPEVVDILDFIEENNTAYIVMEFVKGVDLAKYIRNRGGRLPVEETFRILKPVMEALAAVHKKGIVHRDISPDNIILDPMGGAKLLDFGAVRSVENPDVDKGLAKSTEAILKHGFAPIEQYNTRGSLGPWTDEYAMCATIWYCLTGTIPEEASIRISEGVDPDWNTIPGLTESQRRALEKGLSVRAKDRYPDMDGLIAGLFSQEEAAVVSQPVSGPEPFGKTEAIPSEPIPPQPPVQSVPQAPVPQVSAPQSPDSHKPKGKRWGLIAAIAAVLVVAIVAGGILLFFSGKDKNTEVSRRDEPVPENPAAPMVTEAPEAEIVDMAEQVSLILWVDSVHMEATQILVERFCSEHPEVDMELEIATVSAYDAAGTLLNEPYSAVDIFMFSDVDARTLIETGWLEPLQTTGSVADCGGLEKGASLDGWAYGYPAEVTNGYFMYYDAGFFTGEELGDLNYMCRKAAEHGKKIVLDVTNSWYLHGFFAAAGLPVEMNADGTNACSWNTTRGAAVCRGIMDLVNTGALVPYDHVYGVYDGDVVAVFSGTWDASMIRDAWGDRYGCSTMPSFQVDGEYLTMVPFTGCSYLGVNPTCEDKEWAIALAQYLAGEEAQLLRYEIAGSAPVSRNLINSDVEFAGEVWILSIQAEDAIFQNIGAAYWDPATRLGQALATGTAGSNLENYLNEITLQIKGK